MKNYVLISVLTILMISIIFTSVSSQNCKRGISKKNKIYKEIHWLTLEQAVTLNSKKPRKICIDVYADWFGWCKSYENLTLNNPVIAKYINEHFYAVKFNAERKDTVKYRGKIYVNHSRSGMSQTHNLTKKFLNGKISYPSLVFLNEKMDIIETISGYMEPDELEVYLNYLGSNAYKTQSIDNYRSTFCGKANKQ